MYNIDSLIRIIHNIRPKYSIQFTAYGMYCRENIPGLHYGEILDKSTVEFGNKGEEVIELLQFYYYEII